MKLHELSPAAGSVRERNRVGRGIGSGHGKTAARGSKGQKARSGYSSRAGFEGGQMPLARRIPKRGFHNIFATKYVAVDVSRLNAFEDGDVVDAETMLSRRVVSKTLDGVKILGGGEVEKKLTVKAAAFTASAKEKIEKSGGKAEVV